MPSNPNNVVEIINKNKDKRLIASKIVETNPKVLPVLPKLIRDNNVSPDVEADKLNINRGILEDMFQRIRALKQNNKNIIKLFPEIELAIQILVTSILSPKKMTDIQLNYKLNKAFNMNPNISSEILEKIKEYVEEVYELEDRLPDIVRESLFESGAYAVAIIPESSVDDLINTDILPNYSTEEFKKKIDFALENYIQPRNIIGTPDIHVALEGIPNKENLIKHMVSSEFVNITDNVNLLQFNQMREEITHKVIRKSMRRGEAISTESFEKVQYMDIFRAKKSAITNKNVEFVKTREQTKRKTIGKPMNVRIPTESIMPVFIPGNEAEHIGYFVLLDESGKPLNTELKDSNMAQMGALMQQNNQQQLTPVQKAYNSLVSDMTQSVNVNELFDMYKDVLEKQLYTSIKSSLYGKNAEIANKNDIYFLMFTRALADQKTNLLFIPKELVVYFAFYYNELGIGKTLMENLSVLSSLRAIMLFAKVMAYAKSSIDVTSVNVSLDPNDPDPEKTIDQIQDMTLKMRQNYFPLGISNPVDLLTWIQKAGLKFNYENHPGLPNVKIAFENENLTHTVPDSDLEEELRKQTIISLGLSPETIDSGFSPEFATTVVNNNILLSKRVSVYQKTLVKHLSKMLGIVIFNDEDLRNELRAMLLEKVDSLGESLDAEEKEMLTKDKAGFIEYYIDKISENLFIELPKPDNTNIATLTVEYETYKNGLDQVLDSVISTDMLAENVAGELSNHIDTIKNIYRHHLLRKWMSENNFYPEVLELAGMNDEETENTLNVITEHLTSTMRNSDKILNMMKKFKEAANKDLEGIDGSGASDASGSGSSSSSSDSDDNGDGGGEGGDPLISDTDADLDLFGGS